MYVSDSVKYVGVADKELDIFESQYPLPNGMLYNSYVIMDDKVAVLDTADKRAVDGWLLNVDKALEGRKPDYLVIHHLEPEVI